MRVGQHVPRRKPRLVLREECLERSIAHGDERGGRIEVEQGLDHGFLRAAMGTGGVPALGAKVGIHHSDSFGSQPPAPCCDGTTRCFRIVAVEVLE